jgi:hypothetical protein
MQLSNASVESFADGVLTLSFAQAGVEKGFVTGGYDQDLGQVLADMFGFTPTITTSVGGDTARPEAGPRPVHGAAEPERPGAGAAADGEPKGANSETKAAGRSGESGTATRSPQASARLASGKTAAARSRPARAAEIEPTPGDPPAPDALTGTDLIQRELGGRVIQELDGP